MAKDGDTQTNEGNGEGTKPNPNDKEGDTGNDSNSTGPSPIEEAKAVEPEEEILGAIAPSGMSTEDKYKLFLFGLLSLYVPTKGYQKRREIGVALLKSGKFVGEKSLALRSFFASFLA